MSSPSGPTPPEDVNHQQQSCETLNLTNCILLRIFSITSSIKICSQKEYFFPFLKMIKTHRISETQLSYSVATVMLMETIQFPKCFIR